VFNIFLFFAIARWLLECLDDERGSGWDDGDGGLTVLDGESYGNSETFLQVHIRIRRYHFSWICAFLTQSPVAFAISSPTFFGDRPRGPIFGARAEEAPTSPPVARRWLKKS